MGIVDEIKERGLAKLDCKEVWPELWEQLAPLAREWADGPYVQTLMKEYQEAPDREGNKLFLARRMPIDKSIDSYFSGDPWVMAIPQIGTIAREYFGVMPELCYFDLWNTVPLDYERTRVTSQEWHKDDEGQNKQGALLKAFMYFDDIQELNDGMMEVAPLTGGQESIPMKPGEIIFVDTGILSHRGGYCINKSRLLAVWFFYNPTKVRLFPRYDMTQELKDDLGEWGETLWGFQAAIKMYKEFADAGIKPNMEVTLKK